MHDVSHEARDRKGRWTKTTIHHSEVQVGDRLDPYGKTRVDSVHPLKQKNGTSTLVRTKTTGTRSPSAHYMTGDVTVYRKPEEKMKAGGPPTAKPIYASDLSTQDSRRSPEVSEAEFHEYARRGAAKYGQLDKGRTGPMALEGARFKRLTDEAYDASREPWGGVTVDSHTGEHVAVDADKYALTIRKQGSDSVVVDPKASREDFDNAMDEARKKFAYELSFPGAHLGVFHDADLNRIDIDPVLVTPNLNDVHDIGAFTRATGGAYHFKSGDGFWPPHVKDPEQAKKDHIKDLVKGLDLKAHDEAPPTQEQINNLGGLMSLAIQTPVLHDADYDLSARDGKLAFWKQILPMKSIHYTAKDGSRQTMDFTKEYLEGLASATAVDQIGFLLADIDNRHTMDPERWRGAVEQMEVRDDGLYGKIVFPSQEAAKAVLDNPALGVSARIRPNVQRSDGSTIPAGIIHVLGTLDPQVSGMSGWTPTDLSTDQTEVLDLSDEEYADMPKQEQTAAEKFANVTEADIDAMDEGTLDEYLAFLGVDFDAYTETDEHETDEGDEPDEAKADEKTLVGAGADMSTKTGQDIDLANERIARADARAADALRRVAEAEWREERNAYMAEGVPAAALDLAAPVLNRADDMVIDLSVMDEDDVNVSEVVRGLLDSLKGTVDLSTESGHLGVHTGEDNPDQPILDRWTIEG